MKHAFETMTIFIVLLCATICLANTEEYTRGLVKAAQLTFEEGAKAFRSGDQAAGRALFRQSNAILMQADLEGDEDVQRRIDRIFSFLFDDMAKVDPDTAVRLQAIRTQVDRAYQAAPVQPGQVEYYIGYLLKERRQFLINSFNRSLRYIPMIREEFRQAGIPEDLAYMALVESGFRPDPTSHAGAKGLWQFMPETAKRFGLKVGGGVDERTDPVKSTRAAAQYLKTLHAMFGDWPLAVAAYNCGEGRVQKALKKSGSSTYWELVEKKALPVETQRYVPSIVAATIISRDLTGYGLSEIPLS